MEQQQPLIGSARDQLHWVVSLVRRSFRHFWKAVAVGALGVALSVGVAVMKRRVYLSEAVILYRETIDPTLISNVQTGERRDTKDIGARLQELLVARPRLEKLIDKYELYPGVVQRRGYVEAVDKMRADVGFSIGQGDTFHVSYRAPTPELAQKITDELASTLIAQDMTLRQEQAQATQRFLEEETKRLQKELDRKQQELAQFLGDNPEFAQEQQPEAAGASIRAMQQRRKQAAKGTDALSVLQRQANRLQAQLTSGTGGATAPPDPKLVAAQERAEEELREATSVLETRRRQYTERHPDVVAARRRQQEAGATLQRVKAAVRASRRMRPLKAADKDELRRRLATVQRQIVTMKKSRSGKPKPEASNQATNRIVALETDWQRHNREVRQARDAYVKLEERLFKARLAASSETGAQGVQMKVIDPAFEPTRPAGMGRTLIVGLGLVVSAFFGGVLMLGLGLLDDRVYDRLDIERLGLAPVLVEVPAAKGKRSKVRHRPARRKRAAGRSAGRQEPS